MSIPRVKICGLTQVKQAVEVSLAGADAIGLVFYPKSPRYVSPELASNISQALPPFVQRVGLFVNAEAEAIHELLETVYLDVLQFHGSESPEFCRQFKKPYIKTLAVDESFDMKAAEAAYGDAQAFLLDIHDPVKFGGTGNQFDWNLFPAQSIKPLILAGGLDPQNVAAAVKQCSPYAVDVSSGVEKSKGDKSIDLVRAFIEHAKQQCK